MPRGGKRAADGFSPYKHPDGRELKLLKSSRNEKGGGYYCIVERSRKFYAKLKLDDVAGSKQQKLFGQSSTPREAAIILAEYTDAPWELPCAPPRQPRGSQLTARQLEEKRDARLEELMQEAHSLLGISEEMSKEEEAAEAAAAADFLAWKEARQSQPQPVATGCLVEWGDHGDFHVPVDVGM
jgi:hypothetical protein